jgi:hypothetical protein
LAAVRCPRARSFTTLPSFVDTNVLVYVEDKDAGQKHTISRNLVLELWDSRERILSVRWSPQRRAFTSIAETLYEIWFRRRSRSGLPKNVLVGFGDHTNHAPWPTSRRR